MYLSLLVDVPNTIIKIFKKKLFMAIFQIKNKSQNTLVAESLDIYLHQKMNFIPHFVPKILQFKES